MPNMDGATFLSHARSLSATSTRILLTADTDLRSAIKAVNEGQIFRFLCKPCAPETLRLALVAGAEQHALVTAERDIMERTLAAVVISLGEVLALAEPALFERAMVVKLYVGRVVRHLGLEGAWQIEVAAALHTLGLIALPTELARRGQNYVPVTLNEKRLLEGHPETARRILSAIPRLEDVASIVAQQGSDAPQGAEWVQRGARLLRLAIRVEARVSRGVRLEEVLEAMSAVANAEDRTFLDALRADSADAEQMEQRSLRVRELQPRMILDEDVKTIDGTLVLQAGHELSAIVIERLRQFASSRGLAEPIQVRVPIGLIN
jgi:CheY-like chemotaxis protein